MLATWSSGNPRALVNEPLRRYSAVILSNCLQSVDSQLTVLQNFSFRQMVYIILNQTCQMHPTKQEVHPTFRPMHPTCRIVSKWPTFSKNALFHRKVEQCIFLSVFGIRTRGLLETCRCTFQPEADCPAGQVESLILRHVGAGSFRCSSLAKPAPCSALGSGLGTRQRRRAAICLHNLFTPLAEKTSSAATLLLLSNPNPLPWASGLFFYLRTLHFYTSPTAGQSDLITYNIDSKISHAN